MKILGVGLSKTGTTSLHHALQVLGFKSIHFDTERLKDVLDGTNARPDFRRYDDVDAITDEPTAYFYDELLEVYPMCKCILTIRSEDKWWESIRYHLDADAERGGTGKEYIYGSAKPHEFLYRKKYRQHNERVLAKIPRDRLLVMDVTAGDGWEKLCPFLGTAIPAVPFPHKNTRKDLEREFKLLASAAKELRDVVSPGGGIILVHGRGLAPEWIPGRRVIPFLERDGQYWGPPADDDTAIRELERLRRAGAGYIAFTWAAFWWLDYYTGFHRYLRSRFSCVRETEQVLAFDLTSMNIE